MEKLTGIRSFRFHDSETGRLGLPVGFARSTAGDRMGGFESICRTAWPLIHLGMFLLIPLIHLDLQMFENFHDQSWCLSPTGHSSCVRAKFIRPGAVRAEFEGWLFESKQRWKAADSTYVPFPELEIFFEGESESTSNVLG